MKNIQISGNWVAAKVQFQQSWSALSDEDLERAEGSRQLIVCMIQEKYGLSKVQAENALKDWEIQHRSFL